MVFLVDLVDADDAVLGDLALRAFQLGLRDGRELSGPVTRHELMAKLPGHPDRDVHRIKLRQVYGAGFDIATANKRIKNRERPLGDRP